MPITVNNDAELRAAIARADDLARSAGDADEATLLADLRNAIDAYAQDMRERLTRPAQNDNEAGGKRQ